MHKTLLIFFVLVFCLISCKDGINKKQYFTTSQAKIEIDTVSVKKELDSLFLSFSVIEFKKIDSILIAIYHNDVSLFKANIELGYVSDYQSDTAIFFDKPDANTKLTLEIKAYGTITETIISTRLSQSDAEFLAKKIYNAKGFFNDDENAVAEVADALVDKDDLNFLRNVFFEKYNINIDQFIYDFMDDQGEYDSNWGFKTSTLPPRFDKNSTVYNSRSVQKEFISESVLYIGFLNYRQAILVINILFILVIILIAIFSRHEKNISINKAVRYFILISPFVFSLSVSIYIFSEFTTYESNFWKIATIIFFFLASSVFTFYVFRNFFNDQNRSNLN